MMTTLFIFISLVIRAVYQFRPRDMDVFPCEDGSWAYRGLERWFDVKDINAELLPPIYAGTEEWEEFLKDVRDRQWEV